MDIKVSVIVPVYNVENYLKQAISSVINQTLKEIEIICVNDGSTDSSKAILDEYQKSDDRIIVVNKSNKGYGAACNTGLKLARGKYVAILEPDDFIEAEMYENLYSLAQSCDADMVKSAFYEFSDGIGSSKINWSEQYTMPDKVFKLEEYPQFLYFHPSIWSCIYKTEFLRKNKITFKEVKGAGWVDNPFQVQTLCLAEKICYKDTPFYNYRLTNPSSSSNIVNISNPFDRSDEVHAFLEKKQIRNHGILANLYKRELGYINKVLSGVSDNLFDFACKKITDMIARMDSDIIFTHSQLNDYEKYVYKSCKSYNGIGSLMRQIQENCESIKIVSC